MSRSRLIWAAAVVVVMASLSWAEDPKSKKQPTTPKAASVADRAACSSLCQVKHPLEEALKVISGMGYKYVDLSCLNWPPSPPHVNVAELGKDFDKEAARVQAALKANKLKVSNLTFDGMGVADPKAEKSKISGFDDYVKRYELVIKLAPRLKAKVVNVMAPPKNADRQDVVDKMKVLVAMAKKHDVQLTLETHTGQVTELPADAAWLCKQVPGLGLTLDPSHYYAGPNQGKSFDEVYPYVSGTGLRAGGMSWATVQMPWGEGAIDFTAVAHKLEEHKYRGFYVSEYIEGFNKLDSVEQSKKFLEWAKSVK